MRPSTRLKVAYFIDAMNIAGTETQVAALIDNLDRSRVSPYLFCLRKALTPINPLPDCPYSLLNVVSFKTPSTWFKVVRMARWLRRHQIDIVQTHFADASLFGICAARLARRPLIVMCHRDMGHWHTPQVVRRVRRLNRYADHFVANANCIKNVLVKEEGIAEERVTVLRNCIDIGQFQDTGENVRRSERRLLGLNRDYVVGTVANLNRPIKRVDVFVRSAAAVVPEVPSTDFAIIGDGYLKPDLAELADELGIRDHVHFLGARTDVPKCLSCFDVAVNSSDSEGLSNAIIEYMAAGLPSVVTDTGGNGELIDGHTCGRLVPTNDHGAMANAIIRYLKDVETRQSTGRRARERVETLYEQHTAVERQMDFYENICHRRR